jgi:5-methylcytosine-specific restriction endonuclease McrA
MFEQTKRRKNRKAQFKINKNLKKTLFKNIAFAPCYYCKFAFVIDNLTIEHILPRCLGGTNEPNNITLACAPCNQTKGRESWMFKKKLLKQARLLNNPGGTCPNVGVI